MNVSLLPELEKLVNEKVQSGEYCSRDEVFHAALRLLIKRDQAEDRHDFTERAPLLLAEAERKRKEFAVLAEEWARATRHLSLVEKKIIHPSYFRIIGMGEAAVPLLLETLRDRPAHWFAALRAITNVDPSPPEANPAAAREAWLEWGRSQGLIKWENGERGR
jgi:putative addiction module CopG family antidote